MTLVEVDPGSQVAPYEQLRSQVAAMVARGDLEPGQKLPTVRQLAGDLGLAANTVARAYRELETDGVISTQGRRGTFVRSTRLDDPGVAPTSEARAAAAHPHRLDSEGDGIACEANPAPYYYGATLPDGSGGCGW